MLSLLGESAMGVVQQLAELARHGGTQAAGRDTSQAAKEANLTPLYLQVAAVQLVHEEVRSLLLGDLAHLGLGVERLVRDALALAVQVEGGRVHRRQHLGVVRQAGQRINDLVHVGEVPPDERQEVAVLGRRAGGLVVGGVGRLLAGGALLPRVLTHGVAVTAVGGLTRIFSGGRCARWWVHGSVGGVGAWRRVTALPPARQPTRAYRRGRQKAGATRAVRKGRGEVGVRAVVRLLQPTILQRKVGGGRGATAARRSLARASRRVVMGSHVKRLRVRRLSKGGGHYAHPLPRHTRAAVLPATHGTARGTCHPRLTPPAFSYEKHCNDTSNTVHNTGH